MRWCASCRQAPSFTIVPAHDELGSNAVLCAPPAAVPLRFGDDSYFPHLAAARRCGIEPTIVRLPGIALDIDHPADLRMFLRAPRMPTRTLALLEGFGDLTGGGCFVRGVRPGLRLGERSGIIARSQPTQQSPA